MNRWDLSPDQLELIEKIRKAVQDFYGELCRVSPPIPPETEVIKAVNFLPNKECGDASVETYMTIIYLDADVSKVTDHHIASIGLDFGQEAWRRLKTFAHDKKKVCVLCSSGILDVAEPDLDEAIRFWPPEVLLQNAQIGADGKVELIKLKVRHEYGGI